MAYTRSGLEVLLARPVPTLNDKAQVSPLFTKANEEHIVNSPRSSIATPGLQQYHKLQLIAHLFSAAVIRDVHLLTRRMKT